MRQHSQHCYPTISWKTYLTQRSLACSTSVYHLKLTTYLERSVLYRAQKKNWMTGILFEEWLRKFDSSFRAESRKVALLIDNCPAHLEIKNFTNIKLIFLPPNTTSVLQPMDQGVIRSLKAHYRKKVVRLCIKAVESNKPLPKISIL